MSLTFFLCSEIFLFNVACNKETFVCQSEKCSRQIQKKNEHTLCPVCVWRNPVVFKVIKEIRANQNCYACLLFWTYC
jgi:hypothetical protein